MKHPDAVLKHDGRRVAFDTARLAASVQNAATGARVALSGGEAQRLGRMIAETAGLAAIDKYNPEVQGVIASADIRALTMLSLRRFKFDHVAEAYQNHARAAALLLWRVRVADPEMPRSESAGTPWDRRRLLESLRASGIAFDVAGAAARDVERRIVTLGRDFISPALIHSLAALALPAGAHGAREYGVRRVAFSATAYLPHWREQAALENPLPSSGPALEEFWLQGVHSPGVVKAVRENLLSLDPCPSNAAAFGEEKSSPPADPLTPDFFAMFKRIWATAAPVLNVRADDAERIGALAEFLARIPGEFGGMPAPVTELSLYFKAIPDKLFDASRRAAPVTLNAGGLVAREALRDPKRAAARLSELALLAAQAHREREEYFLRSPVRGRILPVAAAGLWNATAWIQGEGFDATRAAIGTRQVIAPLCEALRAAIEGLRGESGMELVLTAAAPLSAERNLWRNDRRFFLRDLREGVDLNAGSAYESGPELRLSPSMDDFTNRLDFAKAVGEAFDEPPELTIAVPLAPETNAAQWHELLAGLSQAGVACLRLAFGGNARAVPNLTRAIRSYLIGFPLLDGLEEVYEQT